MQREQAEYQATASARVLTKLLSVVDDMDRAFEALPGKKCFLDPLGNVTDYGPEKERERRRKTAGGGA